MAISVFDLFKVGIGPSSSHTVGPMRAAATFAQALTDLHLLSQTRRVEVRLYGSLSATGVGHATDRACVMGLMGEWPDRVDPTSINARIQQLRESGQLLLAGSQAIAFNWHTDLLLLDESLPYHPNAMSLHAYGDSGLLSEQTYYSVGGGFIIEAAEAASGIAPTSDVQLPYDFSSAVELLALCNKHGLRVSELMMANERAWRSDEEIRSGLLHIWSVMRECVEQGLRDEGILPGGLDVPRRAAKLHRNLLEIGKPNVITSTLSAMEWVNLFALAVNEENAAGGRMVTAPTNGAAGIIPAVLHYYMKFNADACNGIDRAFGKGGNSYNRYMGDPQHTPNPCLAPLASGPYYAIRIHTGDLGSACGLVTDAQANVLNRDGQPIAGLYAVGNDMNSLMKGTYPGPGITLGPALTFGWLAANHITARLQAPATHTETPACTTN